MRSEKFLLAMFLGIFLQVIAGCESNSAVPPGAKLGTAPQVAIDSGAIPLRADQLDVFLAGVDGLAKSYGLQSTRNSEVERLHQIQERRPVFDLTLHKGKWVCLWVTNGVASGYVTFQLFREAFAGEEYSRFRAGFLELAQQHVAAGEAIKFSVKDGVAVQPATSRQ